MFGDRITSSTGCSRWLHETELARFDPSRSYRFLKVATQPLAELRLQPTFGASEIEVSRRSSLSKERKPDIVLTVRTGNATRFVVFDAKYRVSRQKVLDAMASAHVYQDSLRFGEQRLGTTTHVPALTC